MKPAWDQLGDEYAGSSSVAVVDVDCTVHQGLCSKYGVSGYPTIKYWKDGESNAYQGGRDFDSLKKHVTDNLQVLCSVEDPKDCTDKEKTFIEAMKAKAGEVESQLERLKGMQKTKAAPALKQWINQRVNILSQLVSGNSKKDL